MTLDINSFERDIKLDTYINSFIQGRPTPIRLLFDTSVAGLSLSKSFLERHGYAKIGTAIVNTSNGKMEIGKYYIPDFWVLGEDFGDVIAVSRAISGLDDEEDDYPGYDGLLGISFIQAFDTTLDFTNNQIHFEPRTEYIQKFRGFQISNEEIRRDMLHRAMRGQIILTPVKK